ncbi:MAG: hypothetical protein ACP5PW_06935 [Candidatus Dormibacteria bacterium]
MEIPEGSSPAAYDLGVAPGVSGPAAPEPRWSCCLPTTGETTVSLSVLTTTGPWIGARARAALGGPPRVTADPLRERYALGGGRGTPQIHGEPLVWLGCPVWLEVCAPANEPRAEVTLRLPPWQELSQMVAEADLWEVADLLALDLGSDLGVVDDGATVGFPEAEAAPGGALRLLRSHLGIIVRSAALGDLGSGYAPYRELPHSGLLLVLR